MEHYVMGTLFGCLCMVIWDGSEAKSQRVTNASHEVYECLQTSFINNKFAITHIPLPTPDLCTQPLSLAQLE